MRWSNDELKSTLHRVRAPPPRPDDGEMTRERYSIPWFISANADKVIDALPGTYSEKRPKKYEPITSGEYVSG
jgi:isopenicillin N synthase-like dioxygenase